MKYLLPLLLLNVVLLSSCQTTTPDYRAGSVAEAKAYARRAVERGVIHQGGEAALIAKQSAGRPLEGKWNPQKIEQYVSTFVAEHPRLVEINLAATKGKITEKDRVFYTTVLETQLAREAEQTIEERQAHAADLNQTAAMMNQTSSYRQNSALMQSTPTSSGYTGFGTGFGGAAMY